MAILTPTPKMQFFAADGTPLSGGLVYTYQAGTTTPAVTYVDSGGVTPNSNPIVLDSRGEADIWLGAGIYKMLLATATDVPIWTVDNISSPTSSVSPVFTGSVVISTDSTLPALTVTQIGTGLVALFEDSTSSDATPVVIDSSGRVGIGTTAPASALDIAAPGVFTGAWAYMPSGTRCVFQQTAAPTGWAKDTSHDNKALRVVSGAVVNGGTVDFTAAFTSQAVSGTIGGTAISTAQMPAHTHSYVSYLATLGGGEALSYMFDNTEGEPSDTYTSSSTGSGDTHDHTFTGTAINLAVKYVDTIIAVKT